jgi:uncharacterized MAPEG superfamily protein
LELQLLGWSVVLLLVQIVLQAASSSSELGLPYAMSPRDEGREPRSVYARRIRRALNNLLETYPAFVGLALALVISGKAGGVGASAEQPMPSDCRHCRWCEDTILLRRPPTSAFPC